MFKSSKICAAALAAAALCAGVACADDVLVMEPNAKVVFITTGGSEALLFAFTAVCDPGDEILAPEPYYTNYNGFATVAGARVRPVPTRLDDGFAIPNDAELDALVTDRTRAFVFSNSVGTICAAVLSMK